MPHPVSPVDYSTMTDAAGQHCFSITTRGGNAKYIWTSGDAAAAEAEYDAYVAALPKTVTLRDGRVIPQRAYAKRSGPAELLKGC